MQSQLPLLANDSPARSPLVLPVYGFTCLRVSMACYVTRWQTQNHETRPPCVPVNMYPGTTPEWEEPELQQGVFDPAIAGQGQDPECHAKQAWHTWLPLYL